jgi:hypothetical protein
MPYPQMDVHLDDLNPANGEEEAAMTYEADTEE